MVEARILIGIGLAGSSTGISSVVGIGIPQDHSRWSLLSVFFLLY